MEINARNPINAESVYFKLHLVEAVVICHPEFYPANTVIDHDLLGSGLGISSFERRYGLKGNGIAQDGTACGMGQRVGWDSERDGTACGMGHRPSK